MLKFNKQQGKKAYYSWNIPTDYARAIKARVSRILRPNGQPFNGADNF